MRQRRTVGGTPGRVFAGARCIVLPDLLERLVMPFPRLSVQQPSATRVCLAGALGLVLGACAAATPPAGAGGTAAPTPGTSRADEAGSVRWTIAPARLACVGVAPTTCLQYRDVPGGPWKNHFGTIEGFEFRPGVETDLLVRFVAVNNPPADGSSRRVVLVRELDRRPTMAAVELPAALSGTAWRLVAPAQDPALSGGRGLPTLSFDAGGRISGNAGVNRFGAAVVVDGDTLRVSGPFTTRMAGPPEAMARETQFLANLQQAARWRIAGDRLRLLGADGTTLMVLERMPRPAGS